MSKNEIDPVLQIAITRRNILKAGFVAGVAPLVTPLMAAASTEAVHGPGAGMSEPGYKFEPSGDDGAGFSSVVVPDPFTPRAIISGQDVSGLWKSEDRGAHWLPAMTPVDPADNLFVVPPYMAIAAVVFSKKVPGKVYAGIGNRGQGGKGGGLGVSVDGGKSWELRSGIPQFAGGNDTGAGFPKGQLRSTGNLIQLDESGGLIYAATFEDGVMRSVDDGRTWVTLGLDGAYLRGLALDPENPDDLYTCPYGNGIWKTSNASSAGTFVQLLSAPASIEELCFVGASLYAVGASGAFRSDDRGETWKELPVPMGSDTSWISITGIGAEGGNLLFAGAFNPPPGSDPSTYQCILRSTNGGDSWEPITIDASHVHPTLGGPDGDVWWYSQGDAWPRAAMGGKSFIASYLSLDPTDPNRLYVSGKGGVWRTDNALDPSPDWYPSVRRLNATFHNAIAVDDSVTPYRVYLGDTDWSFLYSTDGMEHVHINRFIVRDFAAALAFALLKPHGRGPATLYAASENQGAAHGDIFSSNDPTLPGNWNPEGLADAVHTHYGSYKESVGVAANSMGGANILLAVVKDGGVWRKADAGWTQVLTEGQVPAKVSGHHMDFAWLPNIPFAFLYDPSTGVWRSHDAGLTWALIWNHPGQVTFGKSGYMVQPSADRETLWVSASDGLYRLEHAQSGSPRAVLDTSVIQAGPLAYRDGWLYVATYANPGAAVPRLLRSRWPASWKRRRWEDISDETYRAMSFIPHGLVIGPDGRIFCAQRSMGVTVGVPEGRRGGGWPWGHGRY